MKVYRSPLFYLVALLAVGVVFSVVRAAFTEPSNSFPGSAPAAPLDTSGLEQTKSGNLIINGSLGVGMTPGKRLDVFGPLRASGLGEFGSLSVGGTVRINTAAVPLILQETDQVLPDGLWRIPTDGNTWRIDRNTATAGDFSTYTPVFRIDASNDVSWSGSLVGGSVPWDRLTGFPGACPSGQAITALGSTITCAAAGAPSQWVTDPDFGIWYNGGSVGIGPSGPYSISAGWDPVLSLVGTPAVALRNTSADKNYRIDVDGSGSFRIYDITANEQRLRVFSNGTVGFGPVSAEYLTIRSLTLFGQSFTILDAGSNRLSIGAGGNSYQFQDGGIMFNLTRVYRPTCSAGTRGMFWVGQDNSGDSTDDAYVCRKTGSGETYDWSKLN